MKLQSLPTHKPLPGWLTSSRCDGLWSSEKGPNVPCCSADETCRWALMHVSELWKVNAKCKVRLAQGGVKVGLEWFVLQAISGSNNKIPDLPVIGDALIYWQINYERVTKQYTLHREWVPPRSWVSWPGSQSQETCWDGTCWTVFQITLHTLLVQSTLFISFFFFSQIQCY